METFGKYFEDFPAGKTGKTVGKTITHSDVDFFEELSSWPDYRTNHSRLVPEMLVTAVACGLFNRLGVYEGTLIAVAGNSWCYLLPVIVGDTLRVRYIVEEASMSKKMDRGVITLKLSTYNQRNELVAEGHLKIMMLAQGIKNKGSK
jgi:acyl dehydratase